MKRLILILIAGLGALTGPAQNKNSRAVLGLIGGPHVSKQRFHIAVTLPYNTTYSVESDLQHNLQFYLQRQVSKKFSIETNVTFFRYRSKTNYFYDSRYNHMFNYKTITHDSRVGYVGLGQQILYPITAGHFKFSPFAGIAVDLLLQAVSKELQYANNQYYQLSTSLKDYERPLNFSYDFGVKISYNISNRLNLELCPFYKQLMRPIRVPGPIERTFFAYGVSVGVSFNY